MLKNSKILVSVIIPNFNGEKFLTRCLQSILTEDRKAYEIIVVDDKSTDDSVKLLKKKFGQEKKLKLIILKKRAGTAATTNIGIKNSRGKYLFILDNDTKVKKGWFDEIVRFFENHPRAGLAQAKILKMNTDKFDYAGDFMGPFGFLIERARSAKDKGQFDKVEKIFGLKSAAMFLKRNVFEKIKGFDEDYKMFWEETDLAWRIWLAGYEVLFAPKIIVWHAFGTKEKGPQTYIHHQIYYRGCRNTIMTLIKNLGAKKLAFMLPINIFCWLVLAGMFFIRLNFKKGLAIIRGLSWNLSHLLKTLKKRKNIQKKRKVSDQELFLIVGAKRGISYYLGKALAYVTGKPF